MYKKRENPRFAKLMPGSAFFRRKTAGVRYSHIP